MSFWTHLVQRPTKLPDWYVPIARDYPGMYQLTFGGMFEVAAGMAADGLLVRAPVPQLPRWPPPGLTEKRAEELWYSIFAPDTDRPLAELLRPDERPAVEGAIAGYLARFERATGRRAPPGKALAYKFATNDGWLVTPKECRAIADGLTAALARRRRKLVRGLAARGYNRTEESVADLLEPWALYNRFAADHGGYRIW
jgi:hypothetical protein